MGQWFATAGRRLARVWRWIWAGGGDRTPWLRRILAIAFFFLLPLPVLLLLIFRFVPLPGTPEMLLRLATFEPVHYSWRDADEISPALGRAVIAAEDQDFCTHRGFDWKDINLALEEHRRHPDKPLRGASTISQQTARTLFLVSTRSWIRKGLEAYLTVLIEALWPKKRILTAYLNLVDWGHGNYGAEAASRAYFGKSASQLDRGEAARLAAVLPNPERWRADRPGRYVAGRTVHLRGQALNVAEDGLDWCVK
ncbi:MAG: monofunctional biosynthetic peptidoglycan transglycosylase [Alphaproteobacteria bacterium]|nr:monofunctional biosynthetic peptidoglycan transglycosylase [Alphaproteobacteria bacterium]MBV9692069.1 monofunctional biosynthetic peptidoglycan transglycosylase [Alphaproteobacteria bacterium]